MTGDALGGHDGYRIGAEHLGDRGSLGGIVQRSGRAMRVHLLDGRWVEARMVERESHARDRTDTAG